VEKTAYYWDNKCKFGSLKRFLPIISFIVLTISQVQGQTRVPGGDDPVVKFYPNPAISFITFDLQKSSDKAYDIEVYNFVGKMVFEQKNIADRTTINLTEYTRGVYIYQLRDHEGKILKSGKFQVAK
jgi:Secretion system C-terminal sorting domain